MDNIEWLDSKTPMYYNSEFSFSLDSLLLAAFCRIKPRGRLLELGAGCGAASLWLLAAKKAGAATALDIQPGAIELLERSAAESGLSLWPLLGDLKDYAQSQKYDAALANPPYFSAGSKPAKNPARDIARRRTAASLPDFCAAAARNLKQGGAFAICLPAEQLADGCFELASAGLRPKRLGLVYQNAHSAAPWLALLDARYGAKPGGLRTRRLDLYDTAGRPTPQLAQVYKLKSWEDDS